MLLAESVIIDDIQVAVAGRQAGQAKNRVKIDI